MLIQKGLMTRLVTKELWVLTESLHTIIEVHKLFNLHKYDLMDRDLDNYSDEIIWEFYASYFATLRGSIISKKDPSNKTFSLLH